MESVSVEVIKAEYFVGFVIFEIEMDWWNTSFKAVKTIIAVWIYFEELKTTLLGSLIRMNFTAK